MIYHKAIITLGNSSDWCILFDLLWNDELKMHGSRVYSKNNHVFDSLFASNVKNSVVHAGMVFLCNPSSCDQTTFLLKARVCRSPYHAESPDCLELKGTVHCDI